MVPAVGGYLMQQQQQTAAELLPNVNNSVLVPCLNELAKAVVPQFQMAQKMQASVMDELAVVRNKRQSGQEELTTLIDFLRDSSTGEAASDMTQVLKPSAVAPGTVLSTSMAIKTMLNSSLGLSDASITTKTGFQSLQNFLSDEVDQSPTKQVSTTNGASSEHVSRCTKDVIVPTAQCMLSLDKVTEKEDDDDDDDDDDDEDYEEEEDDDDDKLEAGDDDQDVEGDEEEVEDEGGEDEGETEDNVEGEDDDEDEGDEDEMDGDDDGDEEEAEDEEGEDGEDEDDDEAEEESEEEVSESEPPKKKRK